ncbi:class I SAM-dependent methyltransferase [Dactylosporangium vinaceum]|uniref:Methyltransferase domain-containing protein n=1 Tax=Dactylosporangium vinaceum TaxID=53362 RepID=A0ABV5M628_9ACTN|nr:class I SAM-dependent methyltransferase [Dactylosporangium vinaceum]
MQWTDAAAAFAGSYAHLCGYTAPALLDAAGATAGVRLLDVGTGTGTVAALAAGRGTRVTAVDAEPSMVEFTRSRLPAVTVGAGRLPDLDFPDGSFDAVVANFVVNHVADPARAVAELARVSAPGGRVAFTVWPRPAPPLQQLWLDVLDAADLEPAPPTVPDELNFPRTAAGAAGLLDRAGLRDVGGRVLTWEHRTDLDTWWSGAASGMGALGEALAGRDARTVAAARREYERLAGRYVTADGTLTLPTAALLVHGVR